MNHVSSHRHPSSQYSAHERLSWPLVVGFGSLALAWPLVHLVGGGASEDRPLLALGVIAGVALAWTLGAGLGRVPRPVATLTLAGVVYGVILLLLSLVLGVRPAIDGGIAATVALFEIARSAALGALAGLVARTIQRARGRR